MKGIFLFTLLSIFAISMVSATTILDVNLSETPVITEVEGFCGLGCVTNRSGCNINVSDCKVADLNDDNYVNSFDIAQAKNFSDRVSASGGCNITLASYSELDINKDGMVNSFDKAILKSIDVYNTTILSEIGDLYFNVSSGETKWFILENYTFDGTITLNGIEVTISPINLSDDRYTLVFYEPDTITIEKEVSRCTGGGSRTRTVYEYRDRIVDNMVTVYENQTSQVEVAGECGEQVEIKCSSWGWLWFILGILLCVVVLLIWGLMNKE